MAQIIIRNLDSDVKAIFAAEAKNQGYSMEEYARRVIQDAVNSATHKPGMGHKMVELFADCQLDAPLEMPERSSLSETRVRFDDHS